MHHVGNTVYSDGSRQTAVHAAAARELLNLSPGQTLQGEVMDLQGNEVQIQLSRDIVLTAKLESDVKPAVGQILSFEVKNNQGGMLALRPLHTNLTADTNLLKALGAAGLPVNQDTAGMVSALMEEGMPIDKQTLLDTFKTMIQNPDASPLTLVQMKRMNIPVTPETITQFEQYKNYEHQIAASVAVIADEIPKEMLRQLQTQELPQALELVRNVLDGLEQAESKTVQLQQILPEGEAGEQFAEQLVQAGASPEQAAQIQDGTISLQEVLSIVREFAGKEATLLQDGKQTQAEQTQSAETQVKTVYVEEAPVKGMPAQGTDNAALAGMDGAAFAGAEHEKEAAVRETLHAILGSKEFAKVLKSEIDSRFLLRPQEVSKEGKIEEFYEGLRKQTTRLTDALTKASQADTTLAKTVENVRENIDFMHQLNQTFAYVQLPLKMSGRNTHGELFVYANRRNLAKKDGNVSALLHLDMESLGTVDVYVALQNDKLSTKFYLETEELLDFIESNLPILNERLQKRGYNTVTEAVVRENKQTNVMEEMMKQDRNVSLLSTQAFDVRA